MTYEYPVPGPEDPPPTVARDPGRGSREPGRRRDGGAAPLGDLSRRPGTAALLLIVVAVALAVGLAGGIVGGALGFLAARVGTQIAAPPTVSPPPQDRPVSPAPAPTGPPAERGPAPDPESIADVVASALPAVVSLEVGSPGSGASGSGFVIRPDGFILTNNHVIDSAVDDGDGIEVVFSDGTRVRGDIVGRNVSYDLAVVRVDRDGLPSLELGDSEMLEVGDTVIAIGSPLGLVGTVTSGIVSAVDRPVTIGRGGDSSYISAVQTDAAINPGNSGGPLLDAEGRVVGVNSAIAALTEQEQQGSIGLGFAIPSRQADRIARELISTGTSATPVIGVTLSPADGDGALIDTVDAGGPASDAGVLPGDLVVSADGKPVTTPDELVVLIRDRAPGESLLLGISRDGVLRDVEIVLGSRRD